MKAILVIDIPKCCEECQLINSHYDNEYGLQTYCGVDYHRIKEKNKKDLCPLKPMPRKEKGRYWHNGIAKENTYVCGWNDCIDEILGEQE